MSKKEKYAQDLIGLFGTFFETGNTERLTEYIVSNSNLPGPRGNLELAGAFADVVGSYTEEESESVWALCTTIIAVSVDEAPVNDPKELIPFCGAVSIGSIGAVSPKFFNQAIAKLRVSASDPRWRMREGVAMGLQRLMTKRGRDVLKELEGWVPAGSLLELRAVAAAIAEPPLLKDKETAISALKLHRNIIERVLKTRERKTEDFRVLRKALGYTLSVVIRATPQAGFEFMAQLIDSQDPDVWWIVKENLKKTRLTKNFPQEVEAMKSLHNH